jgi:large repetitive protein
MRQLSTPYPLSIVAFLLFFSTICIGQHLKPVAKNDSIRVINTTQSFGYVSGYFQTYVVAPYDSNYIWQYRILDNPMGNRLVHHTNAAGFQYTPDFNFKREAFTWEVCNRGAPTLCDTGKLTFLLVNEPIVAQNDAFQTFPGGTVDFDVHNNDIDPEGDYISIDYNYFLSIVDSAKHGRVTIYKRFEQREFNLLAYKADSSYSGSDSFRYSICDKYGQCDTATVQLTIKNDAPIAQDDIIQKDFARFTYDIAENDNDIDRNMDYYSYTLISPAKKGTISLSLDDAQYNEVFITYNPHATFQGRDTILYRVCDVNKACDTGRIIVELAPNQPPVLMPTSTISIYYQSGNAKLNAGEFQLDPENELDTLSYAVIKPTKHIIVDLAPNGNYYYFYNKPNVLDTLIYKVCDVHGLCTEGYVFFEIQGNNSPFIGDYSYNVSKNLPLKSAISINDLNGNFDNTGFTVIENPKLGTFSMQLMPSKFGLDFTYTPNPNVTGNDTLSIRFCDLDGLCDTGKIVFFLVQNNPPTAVDDVFNVINSISKSVADNDFDVDYNLDKFSYKLITDPRLGGLNFYNGGEFYYQASVSQGADTIAYRVCDTYGACDTANLIINIGRRDTVVNNNGIIASNQTFVNYINIEANSSVVLTTPKYIGITKNMPNGGICTIEPNSGVNADKAVGSFNSSTNEYTTRLNFAGVDTIELSYLYSFNICDGDSSELIDVHRFIINVSNTQTYQIAYLTTAKNTAVVMNPLFPSGAMLQVDFLKQAAHGTMVVDTTNRNALYTPNNNYVGLDTCYIIVCSKAGYCDTTYVYITVDDVVNNRPPTTQVARFQMFTDGTLNESVRSFISDADGDLDTTSFFFVGLPSYGTITSSLTYGTFTYTPMPTFYGVDSIAYRVCDKVGLCNNGYIVIDVVKKNKVIISAPTQDVCVGSDLTMGATYSTNGVATYQWEESADGVNFTPNFAGNAILFMPETAFPSTKFYRCSVSSNGQTETSNVLRLTVHPDPSIINNAQNVNLSYFTGTTQADSNAVFNIVAAGGFDTLHYQWETSADGIAWSALTETPSVLGVKTNQLTLVRPNISAKPYYRAVVKNNTSGCNNAVSASAQLTFTARQVANPLTIVTQPASVEECLSGNAILTVTTTGGTTPPTYQWQQSIDSVTFTNIAAATNPNYMPAAFTLGTTYYRVVIQSGNETKQSKVVKVAVKPNISFTNQPAK